MDLSKGPKRDSDLTPQDNALNNIYAYKWRVICQEAGVDHHMSSASEVMKAIREKENYEN